MSSNNREQKCALLVGGSQDGEIIPVSSNSVGLTFKLGADDEEQYKDTGKLATPPYKGAYWSDDVMNVYLYEIVETN